MIQSLLDLMNWKQMTIVYWMLFEMTNCLMKLLENQMRLDLQLLFGFERMMMYRR